MSIRLILGGPPNSGKSTLAAAIVMAMQEGQIDADWEDLDPWAPTMDYLRGNISKEQRDAQKRKSISKQEISEIVKRFTDKAKKHQVLIADAPGGMSAESEAIYKAASHAIIICRQDKKGELAKWRDFLEKLGVELVAIIISKLDGNENIQTNDLIEAELVGLDRNPRLSPATRQLASLLKSKLGI